MTMCTNCHCYIHEGDKHLLKSVDGDKLTCIVKLYVGHRPKINKIVRNISVDNDNKGINK